MKAKVPSTHAAVAWLVQHCGDLVTKYQSGSDGKTSYERFKNKKNNEEAIEFGECIYARPTKYEGDGKLTAKWIEGVWLGNKWGTNENYVSTIEGINVRRGVHRKPEQHRWSKDRINEIRGRAMGLESRG